MVTSGKSSLSRSRTSPIERKGRSDIVMGATRSRAGRLEEQELEPADLELVAVGQGGLVDALAVEIGAVERTDVADAVALGAAAHLHVAAGDGDVVEEDGAVRVAAGGDQLAVEEEPR